MNTSAIPIKRQFSLSDRSIESYLFDKAVYAQCDLGMQGWLPWKPTLVQNAGRFQFHFVEPLEHPALSRR